MLLLPVLLAVTLGPGPSASGADDGDVTHTPTLAAADAAPTTGDAHQDTATGVAPAWPTIEHQKQQKKARRMVTAGAVLVGVGGAAGVAALGLVVVSFRHQASLDPLELNEDPRPVIALLLLPVIIPGLAVGVPLLVVGTRRRRALRATVAPTASLGRHGASVGLRLRF